MKLICIDSGARRPLRHGPADGAFPWRSSSTRPARGVAEIELMLVIMLILLPILLLMAGAWTIGIARLRAGYDAENNAYSQVVSGIDVKSYTDDPIPPGGLLDIRPGLPNRFDSERATGVTVINYGTLGTNRVYYTEKAVFLEPTWHLNAYPYSAGGDFDRTLIVEWFDNYVGETKTPAIVSSLGLQPPGPP